MTTSAGSPQSLASPTPGPGSSAPVLEFLCLFTHDLRRKQKRWQDGRVKYHTFNRRVMAYDDRGNFIGDMHWRADWDFDAGEEIQLERGGIIVQVSDCVGQQSQDLSELVDKRIQEREQRIRDKERRQTNTPSSRPPLPAPRGDVGHRPEQSGSHTPRIRHRPLTSLIGTPTGHHGRAVVPSDSPFEQRRRTDETAAEEHLQRPTKRRRYDGTAPSKLGYAQSLFGTTLTLSGAPPSSARPPSGPVSTRTQQSTAPLQALPPSGPQAGMSIVPAATPPYECGDGAQSRDPGFSKLPPDRSTTRRRPPLAQAGIPAPVLGRSLEADEPHVQNIAGAPQKTAKRTELRLKSHRRRGLLVLSEQAGTKPTTKPAKEPLLPETVLRTRPELNHETIQREVYVSPLDLPPILRTGDASLTTSTVFPDHAPAEDSRRGKESDSHVYEPGDAADAAPKMRGGEEEHVRNNSNGPVPVDNGTEKNKRGDCDGDDDHSASEAVAEREGNSAAQKRSKRASTQQRISARAADGNDETEQDAALDTTTAPPAAPRLVKLGRKSVRSKELIGYVFNNTGTGSGNGSFSVNMPDHPRIEEASSRPPPRVSGPDDANIRHLAPYTAPASLFERSSKDTALTDALSVGTDDHGARSVSHVSSSPLQQLFPGKSERAQRCVMEVPQDKGVDITCPAETRTREGFQPSPDVALTAHLTRLSDEKAAAGDPLADRSRGQEAAPNTGSVDSGTEPAVASRKPGQLVNPATRGRKAALKSHAAGQVPQPVLPADVGVQAPQSAQRGQSRGVGATSTVSGLPKIKMTFPGFVSAKGGGPWSREAQDLLETGRPN
ncbi:Protein ZGRF1 [Coniochaeta hoffmannii]|uniref:Protein ZGRF1 n=1 Tax=Coniochaeta hoffmannii TaxID=91930 RepID=A0AA38R5Y4_9PEZI|nr:Protein ZGRF1 [Coniochaeta hoffmannii]